MEFIYQTSHLKDYETLKKAVNLYGDRYTILTKALWYCVHGHLIREQIVRLGDVEVDLRINLAFVLPSGHGKLHIQHFAECLCEKLGEFFSCPTSYHPEQLVGKTIAREVKGVLQYQQIYGHFADDFIIFDDAIDLVKGKEMNFHESRTYLCKALDTIGKNRITKRMVNVPREHSLSYVPSCSVILLFQPFHLPEEVFLSGLFRRFITIYLPLEEKEESEYSQKLKGDGKIDEAIAEFSCYLKNLKLKSNSKITFTEKARRLFAENHALLIQFGRAFGEKSRNFTEMIGYTLQDWLLKMSCVLAFSQLRFEVTEAEVDIAFCDLLEFLNSTLSFVETKAEGLLDYGDTWHGAKGDDQRLLQWLYYEGALDESSSKVSISSYQSKIMQWLKLSSAGARRRYQKHIRMGWVKSKRIGEHDSRVWLNFKPNVGEANDTSDTVFRSYREKMEGALRYINLLESKEEVSLVSLASPKFRIGDYVQWVSQGVEMFEFPKKIVGWDRDERGHVFYFLEGEYTGIPEGQLELRLVVELSIPLEHVAMPSGLARSAG